MCIDLRVPARTQGERWPLGDRRHVLPDSRRRRRGGVNAGVGGGSDPRVSSELNTCDGRAARTKTLRDVFLFLFCFNITRRRSRAFNCSNVKRMTLNEMVAIRSPAEPINPLSSTRHYSDGRRAVWRKKNERQCTPQTVVTIEHDSLPSLTLGWFMM